jgi:membrane-bound lytic murein transglycosylase D
MTINELVDERFDVYLSSLAAAQFLQENYRQLGSWPLALTAYNYGRAGMVRAQEKWGSYPRIIKHHETGIFKFASKNFYSEFIAAVRVARRLENDRSLVKHRPWINVTFRLRDYAHAKELSKYFGINAEEFERLNPALRDPVLEGRKYIPEGTLVRLPATKRIRKQIKNIPSHLLYARQIRDKTYRVKKGDTALSIARKYKVSLKELIQANDLGRKAIVRLGQRLTIPAPAVVKNKGKSSKKVVILQATPKEQVEAKRETPGVKEAEATEVKNVPLALADNSNVILTLNKLSKRTP